MTTKWIDEQEIFGLNDKAFLVLFENTIKDCDRYVLRDQPAYTNVSCKPKLTGWCGTHNDVATHAQGAWQVTRIAKSGRYLITQLEGEYLGEFLEEMGYPELIP